MFAPITGAWIETLIRHYKTPLTSSHPSRVRGLKRPIIGKNKRDIYYLTLSDVLDPTELLTAQ